jgi:hypothetical protein
MIQEIIDNEKMNQSLKVEEWNEENETKTIMNHQTH